MTSLEFVDVTVRYGQGSSAMTAVQDVSLEVPRGTVVGLVGESGSGKSTLGRTAVGLAPLAGGKVLLDGRPVPTRGRRRPVQMIFQDPSGALDPRMSVGASIAEALPERRGRRARVVELLEQVHLESSVAERLPGSLSGGQRQRVAVARALGARPEVVVADEITSALDVSVQGAVLNLVKEVCRDLGLGMLFISHNLAVVRHVSDMVAVMYMGQLVEVAPAEQLVDDPQHPYTRMLLDSTLSVGDSLQEEFGGPEAVRFAEPADPHHVPAGCQFHPRCPVGPLVLDRPVCLTDDPVEGAAGRAHQAACHFAPPLEVSADATDPPSSSSSSSPGPLGPTRPKGSTMSKSLQEILDEQVALHPVPGVAVGMVHDGEVTYATHGVTSVEHPLVVDESTLFQFGSTGKTYTATALMLLAEQGKVDLEAPVRTYLPDFKVVDDEASRTVRVKNLLNHTAGWSGDFLGTPERGDRALEEFVAHMADLKQDFAVGAGMSYNNSALSVAGRIIEVVTGKPFDQAMTELVLHPLGMHDTFFFAEDVITRRFAVGHSKDPETGEFTVARPWALPRGGGPAGGMSAPITDQVTWLQFHLGDGTAEDGTRILREETLHRMQEPTVQTPGTTLGDAVGISWMLKDVDGARMVGHGGTTIGQESAFEMVPERGFGIAVLTNGSGGGDLHRALVKAAVSEFLGLTWTDPQPSDRPVEALKEYEGVYRNISLVSTVTTTEDGLQVDSVPTQDFLDMVGAPAEAFEQPPVPIKMVGEEGDVFVAVEEGEPGYTGSFQRGEDGGVRAMHFGGRLTLRDSA